MHNPSSVPAGIVEGRLGASVSGNREVLAST
jgi:hypothetical protein